jgi:hypothetical protein
MRLFASIPALVAVACGLLLAPPSKAQNAPADEPEWIAEPPPPGAPRTLAGPTILDRLEAMTPEERRRLLEKLPPERRRRLEQRLAAYESLPPAERDRLRRQYDTFRALTPEQKQAARRLFRRFLELPPGRRQVLRQESLRLGRMSWPKRQARMASPDFESRYTPEERQILRALAAITPNP